MKLKHKIAHMKSAFNYAQCSTAERLKVGCIIVKNDRIISIGYNGMPSGWNNCCEQKQYSPWPDAPYINEKEIWHLFPLRDEIGKYNLITLPEVLHAESNAIAKLARSTESGENASAFITHQPCLDCAKLLYQSGIVEVYYCLPYRLDTGVKFLQQCNVTVERLSYDDVFQ